MTRRLFSARARIHALALAGLLLTACTPSSSTRPSRMDAAPPAKVKMTTAAGEITLEIYPDKAPITAANFLAYVDAHRYDGGSFYRVVRPENDHNRVRIEVIQGGLGMNRDEGAADPHWPAIAHEPTDRSGIRHRDGTISMARGKPGTARSEFFIVLGDNPALDAGGQRNPDGLGFAAFGRVVAGMDVVRRIQAMEAKAPVGDAYVKDQMLTTPVTIMSVRRVDP